MEVHTIGIDLGKTSRRQSARIRSVTVPRILRNESVSQQVAIDSTETLIEGDWELVNGRIAPNATVMRIRRLIGEELTKLAVSSTGWEALNRAPADGRYWELTYLKGEMHGGGPESLRLIDWQTAAQKYELPREY